MAWHGLIPWERSRSAPLWRETYPLQSLRREMNRMFDDFWRAEPFGTAFGTAWPNIELAETDQEYRVTAELPGLDEKNLDITLDDDVLVIRGEKRAETEDRDRRMSECYYGKFERRIPFEVDIDPDKVSASFKNGVLTVLLPKNPNAPDRRKRIPITKM